VSIVYRHRTADTHEVFYVGIGTTTKRAYAFAKSRNAHWTNVYKKHGVIVEIVAEDISWEQACELEQLMIQEYGRRDLGTGCLVNMTDGGDGQVNPSKETIQKWVAKNKSRKVSQETRAKMSAARLGKTYIQKTVVDLMTGFFYDNMIQACEAINMPRYLAYNRNRRNSKKARLIYI
jgi:hypothetical protein